MTEGGESNVGATSPRIETATRLLHLVADILAIETELRAILTALPVDSEVAAVEMEEGRRPQSLAHYQRSMIECILADDLRPLRHDLDRVAEMTKQELERLWAADSGKSRNP